MILKRIALAEGPSERPGDTQGRWGTGANANFIAEDAEFAEDGSRGERERAGLFGELNMGNGSRNSWCCQEGNNKV